MADLNPIIVDKPDALSQLIDQIKNLPVEPPSLYVDLEGVYLSRQGSLSILQLYDCPNDRAYLVDVHILGGSAFTVPGPDGTTLKDILEAPAIPKVFFDVRRDSDALFAHYHVRLQGIEDIQLMENASRPDGRRRTVNSLKTCILSEPTMTYPQKQVWKDVKDKVNRLFSPEHGGSYEVFNARPMTPDITNYCVGDVRFLPQLRNLYWSQLTTLWRDKVETATKDRIRQSQGSDYNGHGMHMALGPWG